MVLVETSEGTRSALVVNAIQDQRQVVIKSLEANYGHVPGIAAATILGDGRVALILHVLDDRRGQADLLTMVCIGNDTDIILPAGFGPQDAGQWFAIAGIEEPVAIGNGIGEVLPS